MEENQIKAAFKQMLSAAKETRENLDKKGEPDDYTRGYLDATNSWVKKLEFIMAGIWGEQGPMEQVEFDDLQPGEIFCVRLPYIQYFVKIAPYEDANGRYNAEELESGKQVNFRPSERFPIYRDDGGHSWEGPKNL